jgi:hypothetical protein
MSDELEEHAAKHSSHLAYTKADWRKIMLDALPEDLPMYLKDRVEIYKNAKIPESVYKDLDAQVLHLALRARFPGYNG